MTVCPHIIGMLSDTKRSTPQGIEIQMGVNVVAPYLLTELLLPMLKASNGRVVFLSSVAHEFGGKRIDLDYFRNFETRPHDASVNYQQVRFLQQHITTHIKLKFTVYRQNLVMRF